MNGDESVVGRIEGLLEEERRLRAAGGRLDDEGRARIEQIDVELERCWDLLRQRRAKREFGQDPDIALARDPATVERYQQ